MQYLNDSSQLSTPCNYEKVGLLQGIDITSMHRLQPSKNREVWLENFHPDL